MTKADDNFKLYLDERFSSINTLMNAHFININERLDKIEEQTKKTNGRVTELEKKSMELEVKDITHIINCPVAPKLEALSKELDDVRFVFKYPKLVIAGIVVVALLTLATFIETNPLKVFNKQPVKTEISVQK